MENDKIVILAGAVVVVSSLTAGALAVKKHLHNLRADRKWLEDTANCPPERD